MKIYTWGFVLPKFLLLAVYSGCPLGSGSTALNNAVDRTSIDGNKSVQGVDCISNAQIIKLLFHNYLKIIACYYSRFLHYFFGHVISHPAFSQCSHKMADTLLIHEINNKLLWKSKVVAVDGKKFY